MKIAFIYPNFGNDKVFHPPLGVVSVATFLKKNGFNVKIIIGCFEKGIGSAIQKIDEFNPDIVAVSFLSSIFENAKNISLDCKKKGYPIILGGVHPTVFPEETKEFADYIILGEGEKVMLDLIRCLEKKGDISKVKGVAFKPDNKLVFNEHPDVLDINDIPIPDRSLLPFEEYKKLDSTPAYFFSFKKPATTMSVIRGCPYDCIYCQPMQKKLFGSKVRFRKPELVVDEMECLVKEFGVKTILIVDDLFTFSKSWVKDICSEIIKRGLDKVLQWDCNSRVNCIDEELVKMMKEAGCIRMRFGVESGSSVILKSMNKGQTPEQIISAFSILNRFGVLSHAYFMFGMIGENKESIEESFRILKKIKPDSIQLAVTTPLPGTYLYEKVEKDNLLLGKDFDYMNTDKFRIKTELNDKLLDDYAKRFRRASIKIALLKMPVMICRNPKNFVFFLRRLSRITDKDTIKKAWGLIINKRHIRK